MKCSKCGWIWDFIKGADLNDDYCGLCLTKIDRWNKEAK